MTNNKRAFLICFMGIDGSGKTTQAKKLVGALEPQGIRSKYVWNVCRPIITKPFIVLARALFFRGKGPFQNYTEFSSTKRGLFKNPLVSWVYQRLLLFDYLCLSLITIKFPLMLGRTVVCDRYVYDMVVGLAVDFNYSDGKIKGVVKNLLYLLPKPDILFLIDLPEEEGYQRKDDTPSIDYLRERRRIYLNMERNFGMIMLDGSMSSQDLEREIQNKVKEVVSE